jgi:anion-transporting  ArsA/GET3 family ATPase
VPDLVARVIRQAAFRRLLDAAPGWRELITLGKLWHLHTLERDGASRWQLLIVDAPATGHGLSFLSVPKVVVDTVRLGPLHRHTEWVQELLTDRARTLVLPVTLPEELPVRETLELVARVEALGFATGPLLANGVEPDPGLANPDAVVAAVRKGGPPAELASLLDPGVIRASLEHATRRAAMQRLFLDALSAPGRGPVIPLPHLAEGVSDPEGLGTLVSYLEPALVSTGAIE